MKYFHAFTKEQILQHTRIRKFETKIGELVQTVAGKENLEQELENNRAGFAVIGIPEDIGVKANNGVGGTASVWTPFLQSFLNIQSSDFLTGDNILMLGYFDFSDLSRVIEMNAQNFEEKTDAYRHAVNTIDDAVEAVVKLIAQAGKIPIIIGGGHNNAYPCIKGVAKGLMKAGKIPIAQINAINLDAHADYRPLEGRHSGNGFRYAEEDGYMERYFILGFHENYIAQNVWMDIVNNPFMDCISYEDIFIHEKRSFRQAIQDATSFVSGNYTGIELDIDSIEHALSSAVTPVGVPVSDARQYVYLTARDTQAAYLHICEGACQLDDGRRDDSTGKLVSYLVSDFVKAHGE